MFKSLSQSVKGMDHVRCWDTQSLLRLAYVIGGDGYVLFSLVYLHRVGVSSNIYVWASILLDFIVFFVQSLENFQSLDDEQRERVTGV